MSSLSMAVSSFFPVSDSSKELCFYTPSQSQVLQTFHFTFHFMYKPSSYELLCCSQSSLALQCFGKDKVYRDLLNNIAESVPECQSVKSNMKM